MWYKPRCNLGGFPIASTSSENQDTRIEIFPNPAFVDEDVRICVRGLLPHQDVLLRAETKDDENRVWHSHAKLHADISGTMDLARKESIGGSYWGRSQMGLFWSMQLAAEGSSDPSAFAKSGASPNSVGFEAEVDGRIVARAQFERQFLAPGTRIRELTLDPRAGSNGTSHAPHCIARLFIPPEPVSGPPLPVVIVLGGSGGGFDLDKAAVLSRHGFATLALAYFGIPPLPAWLHRVPLDYFEAALVWLGAQPEVDARRVGVLGVSRGAELALLLAAKFPQICGVVAYAPSSVAWAAGGADKATGEIIPAWMWRGKPLPFAPLPLRGFMLRSALSVIALRRPVMFRDLFAAGLRNREAIRRAEIPVERIGGAILLISGGDDHVWPSGEMSEAMVTRLKRQGFGHPVEHLHYPYAGHMLRYPFLPTTARRSRNPHLYNAQFSFGGNPAADAEAQSDSWSRVIAFLRSHL